MRFLDACVDPRVRSLLGGHEVTTASEAGYYELNDHELLPRLQDRIDVLLTIDRGFEFEHNLKTLTFAIVVVHVTKNKVEFYRELEPSLKAAIELAAPGAVVHVP